MSSSSATVRVEKATSDLLIGPDWTLNIDICDSINSNHWQAKDVVKVLKKRLQHKSPKVQLLALTLLETMIKNCGDYVHFQIAERNILPEMIKIVRKKTDMQVRDKILALIDSWQEAFGGPGGKYSQYYWAYEELRRSGVEFPQRSRDAAPIFTPPLAHPMMRHSQAGYGMPSDTSRRLDEAMASEIEHLSLSNLDSMGSVMDLLADMLQAVNPNDYRAVKDEVIVDLVNQCRSNQKRLMQMLTSTGDEELLCQGLALNDSLQILLAKHDAIASGSPLPIEPRSSSPVPTEVREASPSSSATQLASVTSTQLEEEEEEDDDFAQLARRRTKITAVPPESASTGEGSQSVNRTGVITTTTAAASPLTSNPCNELALPTPPTAVKTTSTKEQDMIDLLSITLSTTSTSPHTPPSTSSHTAHQVPVSPTAQGHTYSQQPYTENHGHVPYNYVAPWAQPQPQVQPRQLPQPQVQLQPQPRSHLQAQPQPQSHLQTQPQPQPQPQPQSHLQAQPQPQPQQQFQFPQPSSNYPPPPWATAAPANFHQNLSSSTPPYNYSAAHATSSSSYMPVHGVRPLQSHNSFPLRGNNGSEMYGETQVNSPLRHGNPTVGQKPFIPSYRLFEDLNVLGNADGGVKTSGSGSSSSSGMSGMSGQSMVGGRK